MALSKEKVKLWLKNKNNFIFLLIIVAATLFRLYYFSLTDSQPLWWDEAGYMAGAKSYAGIGSYTIESIRSSGFSRTMSLFFIMGIESEKIMRFFGLFIPSILLLITTYLLLSRMYPDRRIAMISTAIMAVLWENVFYSNRFHTENLALIFQYVAILALFRIYGSNTKTSSIRWPVAILITSVLLVFWYRPGNILFIPAIFLFVLLMHLPQITKTKTNKAVLIIAIIAAIFIFFYLLNSFAENPLVKTYYHPENQLAWNSLNVFLGFFKSPVRWIPSLFFYAFLIGLVSAIFSIYLYFPKLLKEPRQVDLKIKSHLFNLALLFFVLVGFIYFIRSKSFEFRWFFPLLPAMLGFTAAGIINFSDWFSQKINQNKFSTAIILLIVIVGIYTQISITHPLMKSKASSYEPVKEAGLWLNKNIPEGDIVLSTSTPQIAYYSERKTMTYAGMSLDEFEKFLSEHKNQYLMVSVYEGNPPWLSDWISSNTKRLNPVQAYNVDGRTVAAIYLVKT